MDMTVEAANIGLRAAAVTCLGDFDGDNNVDHDDALDFDTCFTGPHGGPVNPECAPGDFDGDIDCDDWIEFLLA